MVVYVSYSHRILIDYSFIKWISENVEKKGTIISRMLRINQNSKEHKKENIVIWEKDFNKLCEENIIKDKDTIRGSVFPLEIGEDLLKNIIDGENIDDSLIRLILGVIMTKEKPFQSVLLTTKEEKKKYQRYKPFLEKIQNFSIKDEEESLIILNDLYRSYSCERDLCRR